MKLFYSISILLITVFGSHQLYSQNAKQKTNYKVVASCYPYITAMGKGKGIVFRVDIINNSKTNFTIDSFFVNSQSLPFVINNNPKGMSLESNYFKLKEDPSFRKEGEKVIEPSEINDDIIVQKKFNPSWVILTKDGKKIKLSIEKYSIIKQKN